MSSPKHRVRLEFDEASLKTLEQLTEEGVVVTEGGMAAYPDDVGISTLSPADRRKHHVAAQLESRDREIARLLAENMRLLELAEAVHLFKKAADDLHIKNAFNTATYRDLEAKRAAEKKLFEAFSKYEKATI
jgi:phage terminase Nu1 subunit (DNA packaging protein)